MTRYVAFLRAINVGGHIVKMEHLRMIFEEMGFSSVRTLVASGNVLFESSATSGAALEDTIGKALRKSLGYEVAVFIRTAAEISDICARGEDAPAGGSLFIVFLPAPLDAREKKVVSSLQSPVDELRVRGREIYWRASKNFSAAIFQPAKLEKLLGQPATFRNVTTVRKIAALFMKPLIVFVAAAPFFRQ